MSIRGRLVSFAIRLALKPMLRRDDLSIEALRARLATTDQMSGPIPKGFTSDAYEIGGVPCRSIAPEALNTQRTLVYFHGGGYVLPGSSGHAQLAAHLGLVGQCRVILVDYRLAPEHPFPAAVEDAMAVVQALHEKGLPWECSMYLLMQLVQLNWMLVRKPSPNKQDQLYSTTVVDHWVFNFQLHQISAVEACS